MAGSPDEIARLLEGYVDLEDSPAVFAKADWELHIQLSHCAMNPIFQLLLNGFQKLYIVVGEIYFSHPECRQHSRDYYRSLLLSAKHKDEIAAESITRRVMAESLDLARKMQKEVP